MPGLQLSETDRTFDSIGYLKADTIVPLPRWAKFHLALGGSLSTVSRSDARHTVAICTPTRAYAAVLIACGSVFGRALLSFDVSGTAHLQKIVSLESGTPVMLRSGKRKLKGYFIKTLTVTDSDDLKGDWIIIQTEQGTERLVPIKDAARIDILDQDSTRLPRRQKGFQIEPPGPLLETMLDRSSVDALLTRTQLDCVLIGPTTGLLERELNDRVFAIRLEDDDFVKGALQDLLRARQYLRRGAAYRAEVLPAGSRHIPKFASMLDPYTVVFDGAIAYLKWAQFWQDCHRIVVLDRTERNFADAAVAINREYIERRLDRTPQYQLPAAPDSIEIMAFEVPA